MSCIFCQIIDHTINANIIYEDELCMAFHDIRPVSPVHFLVIPKEHFRSLKDFQKHTENHQKYQQLLGHLMMTANELAMKQGLENGYKTVIHTEKAGGQEVFHLHIHVMGTPII
jgi:histidine triad (HIT) family protein